MTVAALETRTARGFLPVFRAGEQMRCPACGGANWHVGRKSAECGFCSTALPIADGSRMDPKVDTE